MAAAEQPQQQSKWEGKATADLSDLTADQVWPILEDFCNLHKWLPGIATCYQVEGTLGQPGLVRYCASGKKSPEDDDSGIKWGKERLILIDPVNHCLSYELLENNIGLKTYVGTIKVSPAEVDGGRGCKIEWSFVADPVEGWRLEDLDGLIEFYVLAMAKKVKENVLSPVEN